MPLVLLQLVCSVYCWLVLGSMRETGQPINQIRVQATGDTVNVNEYHTLCIIQCNLIAAIENGLCWARAHRIVCSAGKQQHKWQQWALKQLLYYIEAFALWIKYSKATLTAKHKVHSVVWICFNILWIHAIWILFLCIKYIVVCARLSEKQQPR